MITRDHDLLHMSICTPFERDHPLSRRLDEKVHQSCIKIMDDLAVIPHDL